MENGKMQTALVHQDLSPVHLTSLFPHFLGESGGVCEAPRVPQGTVGKSLIQRGSQKLSDMPNLLIANLVLFLLLLIATQTS